jgi:hypothetical protein
MSLSIYKLQGEQPSYLLSFTHTDAEPPFRIVLDPTLEHTIIRPGDADVQQGRLFPAVHTVADIERVPDIVLLSGAYLDTMNKAGLGGNLDWELAPKLLASEFGVRRMQRWRWFPYSEKLHSLGLGTPYLRFVGAGKAKVEIELLGDSQLLGIAFGMKFCYRNQVASGWKVISVLFAPGGTNLKAATDWCETLGVSGLNRVEAEDWMVSSLLESRTACQGQEKGKLDVLIHPFQHVNGVANFVGGIFAAVNYPDSRVVQELCQLVDIQTFVRAHHYQMKEKHELRRTSHTYPKSKSEFPTCWQGISEIEDTLRKKHIAISDGGKHQGLQVIELAVGSRFIIRAGDDHKAPLDGHPGKLWMA